MRSSLLICVAVTALFSVALGSPLAAKAVTDEELLQVSEELFGLDVNNVGSSITISRQGQTSSTATDDQASGPLYTSVAADALTGVTLERFALMFDNYDRMMGVKEDNTGTEQTEVTRFLDVAASTELMIRLEHFLKDKNLISDSLRAGMKKIWWNLYSRTGTEKDSCGFEHVFVGDVSDGTVSGISNWINFYQQEQAGNLDYMGYIGSVDLGGGRYILPSRVSWYGDSGPTVGGYIGVSPEFEMSMYTLCYYTRPNGLCPVQSNGHVYSIQTSDFNGEYLVGEAHIVL